ncbi:TIGR02444 family protein [Marinicauda algicola]|uniref:TIGR02444 family protein n=1 Tax=Marinicauda algicola TaxID=2029849 RepID=A0A4S2H1A6_9PROT|nr:TIGR02444 family protein [Marinicauda algicola]TGY89266.1 TIGR02444 family protein [Marinicauda algicola]
MTPAPSRFWDFSVAVYGRPGVKPACLALQADGLDVNVALWVAWTSAQGRDPRPALGEAVRRSALWGAQVVTPLRAARDALRPAPGFVDPAAAGRLRETILKAELEAERLEQDALEPLAGLCPASGTAPRTLCEQGLGDYAARLGVRPEVGRFVESVFSAPKKG